MSLPDTPLAPLPLEEGDEVHYYPVTDVQGTVYKLLDMVIKLNQKYFEAYINRGVAKYKLGKYEEAIKDFDEAIKHNPDNPILPVNKTICKALLFNKQKDDAIKEIKTARRLAEKLPDGKNKEEALKDVEDAEKEIFGG